MDFEVEEPLKGLVIFLNNHGFKTTCSCGHNPHPYITMEWNENIEQLYDLLVKQGYFGFVIKVDWVEKIDERSMEIIFYPHQELVSIDKIRKKGV